MRKTGLAGRESGQAIIEYVLLLVIVVSIILGIMHQFSDAFRKYTRGMFDPENGYIVCLLETGVLPGDATCQDQFAAFSLSNGKALVSGGGGSGGGSGGGPSGQSSNPGSRGPGGGAGGSGTRPGDRNASRAEEGGGAGAGGEIRSSGGNGATYVGDGGGGGGGGGRGFLRPRSTKVGQMAASSKEESSLGGADSLLGKSNSTAVATMTASGKAKPLARGFAYMEDEKSSESTAARAPITSVGKNGDDGGGSLRPKKAVENVSRGPSQEMKVNEGSFGFGDFIRYLLIIAVIIAILLFFGGQLLQMSKSWEK